MRKRKTPTKGRRKPTTKLAALRQQFLAGDKRALIDAVAYCARTRRVVPSWAAKPFNAACQLVAADKVRSWDDAFGKPHRRYKHLAAARNHRRLKWNVAHDVLIARRDGASVSQTLFEDIGKKYGIGASTARDLNYEALREKPPKRLMRF